MTLADQIAAVLCASGPQTLDQLARYGDEATVLSALDELHRSGRMVCTEGRTVAYRATAHEMAVQSLAGARASWDVMTSCIGRHLDEIERLLREEGR